MGIYGEGEKREKARRAKRNTLHESNRSSRMASGCSNVQKCLAPRTLRKSKRGWSILGWLLGNGEKGRRAGRPPAFAPYTISLTVLKYPVPAAWLWLPEYVE